MKSSKFKFIEIKKGMTASLNVEITNDDVNNFVELTGDRNPLHVDRDFGKKSAFKKNVVHGFLTTSYVSTLVGMLLPGENGLILSATFDFLMPIFEDDKILIVGEVNEISKSSHTFNMSLSITRKDKLLVKGSLLIKVGENGHY